MADTRDKTSRFRISRAAVHITSLWALAVAGPLYDVLRRSAEFFVAYRADRSDVLLFVAVVSFLAPLAVSTVVWLAGRLSKITGVALNAEAVQTNIIIFGVAGGGLSSAEFLKRLADRRVLAVPVDAERVRMVTHLDVSRSDIENAAEIVAQALAVRDHTPAKTN